MVNIDEPSSIRFINGMTMQLKNNLISLLDDAVEAWKTGSGDTDAWARAALRSLIAKELTPMQVVDGVYKRIAPRDARGGLASPKVKGTRISVRNLENTSSPVVGAASARKNLETVLTLFYERVLIAEELDAFCKGRPGRKLYGLLAELKKKKGGALTAFEVMIAPDLHQFVDDLVDCKDFENSNEVFTAALKALKAQRDALS